MTNLSSLSKGVILDGVALGSLFLGWFLNFTFVGFCLAGLLILGNMYLIHQAQKRICYATNICKKLENGDFETRALDIPSHGELANLLWAINDMTDRMDAFVRESTAAMEYVSRNQYFRRILEDGLSGSLLNGARVINSASANVAEKMDGFSSIANDVDRSLKSVVLQINDTVETLEGNAHNMGQVVSSTKTGSETAVSRSNDASVNVQSISAAAVQMSSCISEISAQIVKTSSMAKGAVSEAQTAGKTVLMLSATAENISKVVTLIEDIADQTNLLALNATIEAARAGEAGKGFAVVASEVKDLASETSKATEEIRTQISEVQEATKGVVRAVEDIGHKISDINQACTVVAAAVEEQSAASNEIANNAEKASNATNAVNENVQGMSNEIMHVDELSTQVVQMINNLSGHCKNQVDSLLAKMSNFMDELKKIA